MKTGSALNVALVVFIIGFTGSYAHLVDEEQGQGHRCDDVHSLGEQVDQCAFVTAHCMEESITLRLVVAFYCAPGGILLQCIVKLCTIVTGVVVLITLFKMVGLTAEKYFSVMLSQISQDLGLPPRLAGVTFLALGNGAPDLSSSIAAIRSGNFNLAMGSLIGSVMFVGCVVAGRIVSLSDGIKSRAAQIRDILALCIAVVCVTIISSVLGRMTYGSVSVLLSLYGSYVLMVAIADLTKRNYGIEWVGLLSLVSGRDSSTSSIDALDDGHRASFTERLKMALLPEEDGSKVRNQYEPIPPEPRSRDVEELHSTANDSSNTSSEVELTESPRKSGPVGERSTWGGSYGELRRNAAQEIGNVHRSASESNRYSDSLEYHDLVSMSTAEYRARALAAMSDAKLYNKKPNSSHEELNTLEEMLETICEDDKESPSLNDDIEQDARQDGHRQTEPGIYDHRPQRSGFARAQANFSAVTNRMVVPIEFMLRASIPVAADTESFDRTWFIVACGVSPIWTLLYLSSFSPTWAHMCISISIGAIFFYLAWYKTHQESANGNSACSCGTNFPLGAALVAVYGFALAGMWIDTIAGELVGVIHAFGIIGHVKPSILGLTVLAWGNSLTDLMANISIALQSSGGSSMAMTACFAGPLFNLLLGLGIGFIFYLTEKDVSTVPLEFDIIVFIGCLFSVINCIGVISIALTHNQRLPTWSGWLMMGWYGLYMALILTISTLS